MDGGAPLLADWSPASAASAARAPRRTIGGSELEFLLDCVADGMLVVDARARVLHANRPARELLGRIRDPACGSGALVFCDRPTQRAFERALAGFATQRDDEDDIGTPAWADPSAESLPRQFLVRDASGCTVARAAVEPLQRGRHAGARCSAHIVALHRQPDSAEVSAGSLRALYGLTPCEARVAVSTLAAHSVDDLAQRLGLSRNTVKSHLKRIFRKCEVCSFAQLAALVATGPRLR